MNLFFLRDQSITTSRGRVIGQMNSPQRAAETAIIKAAYENLGEPIVFEVQDPGRLEGGDFIPMGDVALIGQGLRTNEPAIRQLLDNKVFGTETVVAVRDSRKEQDEMHLDTYFNVIGESLVAMLEERMTAVEGSSYFTVCDVYQLIDGAYQLNATLSFPEFLKSRGVDVILVSKEDQLAYGLNFLTIGRTKILLVKRDDGVSSSFRRELQRHNVTAIEIEMSSLTKGYGAAHCTTQVARRRDFDLNPNSSVQCACLG